MTTRMPAEDRSRAATDERHRDLIDPAKVNVNGSGCSLGHPVAATDARVLVTLVHELRRGGGGIGTTVLPHAAARSAAVIEVPAP